MRKIILTLIVGLILNFCISPLALAAASPDPIQLFETHCVGCHPQGGNIIRRGKSLKLNALKRNKIDTVDAIATLVTNGKNPMSAYKDRLSEAEILAVSQYTLEQAQNNWETP